MRIGILISGGDAPGLYSLLYNTRIATQRAGAQLWGISGGYGGILRNEFSPLGYIDPSLASSGGSPLPSGRLESFSSPEVRQNAIAIMRAQGIDALIVAGGEGSLHGARLLSEAGFPTIGIPVTIDGDVYATQTTLGLSTAVARLASEITALHCTAAALPGRIFLVEALGGRCGAIPALSALAAQADLLVVAEGAYDPDAVAQKTVQLLREKGSVVGVIAEGAHPGWTKAQQNYVQVCGRAIEQHTGVRARYTVVGYGLRGLPPTSEDAHMACACAHLAVNALLEGQSGLIAGKKDGKYCLLPNDPALPGLDVQELLRLADACGMLP